MQKLSHDARRAGQLIDALEKQGYAIDALLADLCISRQDLQGENATLPFATIAALFEKTADLTGNDLLGFHRGAAAPVQEAGLLGYVGRSAPTLLHMFRNLARYRRVMSDAIEIDLVNGDGYSSIFWHYNVPANTSCRQFVEYNAATTTTAVRTLTGRNLTPVDVNFAHPRKSRIGEFERFFGCPVRFGASANRIRFTQKAFRTPLLTADPALRQILVRYCEEILKKKEKVSAPITAQVERELVDRLSTGDARQDIVAAKLGMSTRTLARRLADEGTTFHNTLENLRESLARAYLSDSSLSLTEISFLLGYTDASSFSTAFRRWTGQSPRAYRAQT